VPGAGLESGGGDTRSRGVRDRRVTTIVEGPDGLRDLRLRECPAARRGVAIRVESTSCLRAEDALVLAVISGLRAALEQSFCGDRAERDRPFRVD
jgi:hypothetical protein